MIPTINSDELKKELLAIFVDLIALCDKHGLEYYLSGGTAIGALRHQGFIPWDDDIDIYLKREDYNRFLALAPALSRPESPYEIIDPTMPGYYLAFAKFCRKESTIWESEDRPFLTGLYIDVFPLDEWDGSNKNIELAIRYRKTWEAYSRSVTRPLRGEWKVALSKLDLKKTLGLCHSAWLRTQSNRLDAKLRRMEEEIQDIHGDYLYCYGLNQALQNKVYPKAWFEGRVDVQFEGIRVKTHTGTHEYLSKQFGDYMTPPPEAERVSLHGRFFLDLYHRYRDPKEVYAIIKG